MRQMQSLGFGDTLDERIFFAGPPSSHDPLKHEQVVARRIAGRLLRETAQHDAAAIAHSERVATWARRLGTELGMSADRLVDVELGALLHGIEPCPPGSRASSGGDRVFHVGLDVGSAHVVTLHRRPDRSVEFLRAIPELRRALPIVQAQYERFDGAGFPYGLRGRDLPLEARVFHVAEAYATAMRDRPAHCHLSNAEAREEILRGAGTRFDPIVVEAFARIDVRDWCAVAAVTV